MVQRPLSGIYNLAIKIHHKLNFSFHSLGQGGGIFLHTFIWFQIGLSHNHKHSETPWYFNAFKITWAFKNKIHFGSVLKENRKGRGKSLGVVLWVRGEAPCLNELYLSPQCEQSVALEAKPLWTVGPVKQGKDPSPWLAGLGVWPHPVNI